LVELGFTEDFLVGLFLNAGFSARELIPPSFMERAYTFTHRGARVDLSENGSLAIIETGWNTLSPVGAGQSRGRPVLDSTDSFRELVIDATNTIRLLSRLKSPTETRQAWPALEGERKGGVINADPQRLRKLFSERQHTCRQQAIGLSRGFTSARDFRSFLTIEGQRHIPHFPSRSERAIRR